MHRIDDFVRSIAEDSGFLDGRELSHAFLTAEMAHNSETAATVPCHRASVILVDQHIVLKQTKVSGEGGL